MDNFKNSFFYRFFNLDSFSLPILVMSIMSFMLFESELYGLLIAFLVYTIVNFIKIFLVDFAWFIKSLKEK